ncbi:CPBP family intramembrane glutamic endopeptidase [Actinomyces ruminicola]|uniref:CPBP family intramembrane glutamic endopeptidase n=1 Tax=Actinomyces ruminicola TaxID=332524 RepID=UPI0011CA92E6|nr:CPBP family intramembrane glutamic endopeptidase [Actinomyces ruminicola]
MIGEEVPVSWLNETWGLALFVFWWFLWFILWVAVVRRPVPPVIALFVYELTLIPVVVGALISLEQGTASPFVLVSAWNPWVALGVGAASGFGGWLLLTAGQGVRALLPLPKNRILLARSALDCWSALGEELAFRYLLLSWLITMVTWWVALLIAAALFGMHHFPVGGWKVALVHTGSGLLFGSVQVFGGGLIAAIAAHCAYNLVVAVVRVNTFLRARQRHFRFGLAAGMR